jgi:hypothetical protein
MADDRLADPESVIGKQEARIKKQESAIRIGHQERESSQNRSPHPRDVTFAF